MATGHATESNQSESSESSKLNCLLAGRIDIDARDNLERTPLHLASIEGHPEVVQLLLQFRALDSFVDVYG